MKKIKLFLYRYYHRIIRLFISFSAISCIAFLTLYSSAASDSDLYISSVTVGGSAVSFSQQEVSVNGSGNYNHFYANSNYGADFNFNSQIVLNKGDTVTVDYVISIRSNATGFGAFFGLGGARFVPPLSSLRKVNSASADYQEHVVTSSVTYTSTDHQILQPFFEVTINYVGDFTYPANITLISFIYRINNDPAVVANEAANAIKDNQDKNTDKIISSFYGNDYSSNDTTTADNYQNAEKGLIDDTSSARSAATENLRGISRYLDSHIGKSLLGMTKIVTEFVKVTWLSDLLHFSLTIGLFAFILGLSCLIVSVIPHRGGSTPKYTNHRKGKHEK